jgi:hypothetical protein
MRPRSSTRLHGAAVYVASPALGHPWYLAKASERLCAGASIVVRGIQEMEGPLALRAQLNRTFVVGLAGATIASLGLFTLSRAGGEIRDEGRAKLKATSECASGRQPIATTFHPDVEVTAFNPPLIQLDK